MDLFIYLAIGAIAGTLGGLLGIGGGLVIVPSLAWLFSRQTVEFQYPMHLAVGTSLACVVFITGSSAYHQWKRGAIETHLFKWLAPTNFIGGLVAGLLAAHIPGLWLRAVFSVFLLLVSVQIGLGLTLTASTYLPGKWSFATGGFLIGLFSALVGVGGGTLSVPFLLHCRTEMRHAIGTSSALGVVIGLAGSVGYILSGWGEVSQGGALGFIYWPAFLPIAFLAVIFAPLGVRLAHYLPSVVLRRLFGGFLGLVALRMLLGF